MLNTFATKIMASDQTGDPQWVAQAISALVGMLMDGNATVVMGFIPTSKEPVAAVCFDVQQHDGAIAFKGPIAILLHPGGNPTQFVALDRDGSTQENIPAGELPEGVTCSCSKCAAQAIGQDAVSEALKSVLQGMTATKPGGDTIN